MLNFIVFNVSPVSYHLWYLGAVLYTLLIIAAVYRESTRKLLWCFIPVLLSVDLTFGEYSVILFNHFKLYYFCTYTVKLKGAHIVCSPLTLGFISVTA